MAGAGVDGDDDDDHAFLGQELAVPQHPGADVADDAVDVKVTGRHLAGELDPVGGDLHHVAVLGQEHRLRGHPHLGRQATVVHEVAELPVHGDEGLAAGRSRSSA